MKVHMVDLLVITSKCTLFHLLQINLYVACSCMHFIYFPHAVGLPLFGDPKWKESVEASESEQKDSAALSSGKTKKISFSATQKMLMPPQM